MYNGVTMTKRMNIYAATNGIINQTHSLHIGTLDLYNLKSSYERGFSFFSLYKAKRATPATFTTLNRTPGISPT